MDTNVTDALSRRLRHERQSTGKRITPTEADILTFEVLHRHGPLPSTYIHEFTKHLRRSEARTKDRLGSLYHEDNTPHGGTYLNRPWQQWQTMNARYQPAVSENTPLAEQVLRERGILPVSGCAKSHAKAQFTHQFMVACITASIELAVQTGEIYSQGWPLDPVEEYNRIGQQYQGPVVHDGPLRRGPSPTLTGST